MTPKTAELFKDGLVRIKPPTDTPGEGWRFLETGEFFKRGDEFLGPDGLWAEVFRVDVRYDPQYHYKTRRRIKPPLRLMRPDEFPPTWWFKVSDDWYSTVVMSDKGFQNIGMYQAWNDVDFDDKWSDRPFGTEKSFFVEDVK